MKILRRRIGNPESYLKLFNPDEVFYISIPIASISPARLHEMGFSPELNLGEQILPSGLGPISSFNSDGKFVKLKELPMETAFRQVVWRWKDWGGHEHSRIVDVPYQRYQRMFIEPPSMELSINMNSSEKIIISKTFKNSKNAYGEILHCINLFLELFGVCELIGKDFIAPQRVKTINLNWEILPPGEYPWEIVKTKLSKALVKQPKGNLPVVKYRIETIANFNPDFCAAGRGGFNGYLVFGFESKNLYILESIFNNNATYVFNDDWETFSKMTKKEVIDGVHYFKRLIHREGWKGQIISLMVA